MPIKVKCLLIGFLAVVLGACSAKPPAEEQLRQQVASMQHALEQRRAADFMQAVSADFVGNGQLDREQLERLVTIRLMLHQDIGIQTGPLALQVDGQVATLGFQAMTTGTTSGRWLPEAGRISQVQTYWRLDDGQWQLYRADWE